MTTFQHDGHGRLSSITQPDPDGGGPLAAPATSFGYDPATHLMTSPTNAEGQTSSFAYDSVGTLSTITHPDQQQQHVRSIHVRSIHVRRMVDAAAGSGTSASPAPLVRTAQIQGEVRDALGLPTTFTTDRFGLTTQSTD